MQKQEKKCTKKRDVRAKLLFCLLNQLFFLTFSLPSAPWDLKKRVYAKTTATVTKTSLKKWICATSKPALSRLFHLVSFVNCWQIFLELNANGLHQSSRKEKWESCCLLFPSSTKREIRQFHVVVVQRRQRNVQKNVMHVQNCCFACLNLLLFCRSRSPRRRRRCVNSLKSLMEDEDFYLRRKWPSKTI